MTDVRPNCTSDSEEIETVDHGPFLARALEQARLGFEEGGVPIGSVLVIDGEVVAVGRNRRVQEDSSIRHGEMDCIENAGRLKASDYQRAIIYTTLSPCHMCTGTILLYGITRIVIAENRHFAQNEEFLRSKGVEVTVFDDRDCWELMERFVTERPELWAEDIGEEVDELPALNVQSGSGLT